MSLLLQPDQPGGLRTGHSESQQVNALVLVSAHMLRQPGLWTSIFNLHLPHPPPSPLLPSEVLMAQGHICLALSQP